MFPDFDSTEFKKQMATTSTTCEAVSNFNDAAIACNIDTSKNNKTVIKIIFVKGLTAGKL